MSLSPVPPIHPNTSNAILCSCSRSPLHHRPKVCYSMLLILFVWLRTWQAQCMLFYGPDLVSRPLNPHQHNVCYSTIPLYTIASSTLTQCMLFYVPDVVCLAATLTRCMWNYVPEFVSCHPIHPDTTNAILWSCSSSPLQHWPNVCYSMLLILFVWLQTWRNVCYSMFLKQIPAPPIRPSKL